MSSNKESVQGFLSIWKECVKRHYVQHLSELLLFSGLPAKY